MSHGPGAPVIPLNDQTLDIWRFGLVAYRKKMQTTVFDLEGRRAAVAAMVATFPELTEHEARQALIQAIAWITRSEHAKWFWQGWAHREWIWPPTAEGVGLIRYADKD